jgi:aminoglycoside phosphotransferase (APT) family kinase protein
MSDTKPVRIGEELNIECLSNYLRDKISGEITVAQFPSGNSNLTYCVKIGEIEYVLRRPPFGNTVKSAHDMSREFNVLDKLSKVYSPAPKPLLLCQDETIIGSEFYLMERRNGLIIRGKLSVAPASAGDFTLSNSADLRFQVVESFIQNLVNLHKLDYKAAGLAELGKPEGYAKRQIEGWSKRYFNAKTDEHIELEKTIEWLNANIPNDETASLVHNDYKFDNILLNPNDLTEIVAVLDWEMTTIGSPLMDFGTTLGYWMSKEVGEELLNMPFNPRVLMENVSRQQLAELYAEKSGRDLTEILFYYVFGTFKIAVIAQQIYARFTKGFTQDKRFEKFNHFVNALGKIALLGIQNGKI